MQVIDPTYALYKRYNTTLQEREKVNERLNKMASSLGIEWGEFEELLNSQINQAKDDFERGSKTTQLLIDKALKIQEKIEELAKSQDLGIFEFVDLMKKL